MPTIWKFPLQLTDEQVIDIPSHAEILTVQAQGEQAGAGRPQFCLWARVVPTNASVRRAIRICGTGHEAPMLNKGRYIATVQTGPYVWHFFDMGEVR